jgi:hypothetical protein
MQYYKTFKRSATSFSSFSHARKFTVERGLTFEQASYACKAFNDNRTQAQIRRGTKLEFEAI